MKKFFISLLSIIVIFSFFNFGNLTKAADKKIKLKVVFLEEGSNTELAPPKQLEGDQGVFASISIPENVNKDYTVASQSFDAASLALIQNNDLYSKELTYQIFFKKRELPILPPVVQQGTHTLKVEEFTENGKNWQINYPDAVDESGKKIKQSQKQTTDFAHTFGYFTIDDDGTLVWCFDPNLPANSGDKYEKRDVVENTVAALIQNFGIGYRGIEKNALNAASEQKRLWEAQGNKFPNNPYVIERTPGAGDDNLRQLTEAEKVQIEAFNKHIDKYITMYNEFEPSKIIYTFANNKDSIFDNTTKTISVEKSTTEQKVTLKGDATLLEAFSNGNITLPAGFNATISGTDLIITIPANTAVGEYEISMSMIREAYTGDSIEYYSNYGGQPLQLNKIKTPKKDVLKIKVEDSKKPENPAKVDLEFTKALEGRELKEDEFTFELVDKDGKVIATATNSKDGKVVFSNIEINEEGTFEYNVREVANKEDIIFDTDAKSVSIKVETIKDSFNKYVYKAEVTYSADREFNNKVKPEEPTPPTPEEPKKPTPPTPEEPTKPEEPSKPEEPKKDLLPKTGLTETTTLVGFGVLAGALALTRRRYFK